MNYALLHLLGQLICQLNTTSNMATALQEEVIPVTQGGNVWNHYSDLAAMKGTISGTLKLAEWKEAGILVSDSINEPLC